MNIKTPHPRNETEKKIIERRSTKIERGRSPSKGFQKLYLFFNQCLQASAVVHLNLISHFFFTKIQMDKYLHNRIPAHTLHMF